MDGCIYIYGHIVDVSMHSNLGTSVHQVHMYIYTSVLMYISMDGWIDVFLFIHLFLCIYGWMDGWIDGWMDRCISIYVYLYLYLYLCFYINVIS
jgi:hypothetical protein